MNKDTDTGATPKGTKATTKSDAVAQDGRIAPGTAPTQAGAGLVSKKRIAALVAACLAVVLIVVCAILILKPAASSVDETATAAASSAASQKSGSQSASSSAQAPLSGGADAAAPADAAEQQTVGETTVTQTDSGSVTQSGSDAGTSQAQSSPSAGASQGGSSQGASSSGSSSSTPATVTVHVSVSSSAVGSPVSYSGSFTFEKGATAYDALVASGLNVNASESSYGIYVAAVGGLAEKEHGDGSGWIYAVNGNTPGFSCDGFELSDGDSVSWTYVTD